MNKMIDFREALPEDSSTIHDLLISIARHEGRPDSDIKISPNDLKLAISSKDKKIISFVCYDNIQILGMAICCERFSPYSGGTNLLLVDFGFFPEARGQGLGSKFFDFLRIFATKKNYSKIEWFVDKSNHLAKNFYRNQGGALKEYSEHWECNPTA